MYLGNLDAKRDWGHARDYVEMMWLMMQQEHPDDYVIATGRMETVRKFIEISAHKIGWGKKFGGPSIKWEGEGMNEVGRRADTNEIIVRVDNRYFRPTEVDQLKGDSKKAFQNLGWESKTSLNELVSEMVELDLKEAFKDSELPKKN